MLLQLSPILALTMTYTKYTPFSRIRCQAKFLIGLWALLASAPVFAADANMEKQWAEKLEKSIKIGKPEWLQAKGAKFLTIYTADRSGALQGGLILVHGLGMHPDAPEVIRPIRSQMPRYGWATLSLQMPVLGSDANLKDYGPLFDQVPDRIRAGIEFLKTKNIANVVLVGYDLGAAMATSYLAQAGNSGNSGVHAFIGISMDAPEGLDPRMHNPSSMEKIVIPIMDVYGKLDDPDVTQSAKQRSRAARTAGLNAHLMNAKDAFKDAAFARTAPDEKAGSISYRQIIIPGADHSFVGHEDMLVKRIRGWLQRHAAGKKIKLAN